MEPERVSLAREREAMANVEEAEEEDENRSIPLTKQDRSVLRRQQTVAYRTRLANNQRRLGITAKANYRRQRSFGKRHKG